MNKLTIKSENCKKFIEQLLVKLGATSVVASKWAELIVETSLLSCDSHGIRMLERYVAHVEGGGIDICAEPEVITQSGGCINMDAKGGLGHISADIGTSLAIEKAKEYGISCVTIKNCNHVGACGLYVRKAAINDCLGICTTTSRPVMAPWGGKIALLGSNPIAISAPIEDMPPFVFDAASTMVSMGKITAAKDYHKKIPNNWALDKQGKPTTNPSEAIEGTLLPIGEHKGYGLGMAVDILSAFLAGGIPSSGIKSWIKQTEEPIAASFTIIVLDISKFQNVTFFKKNMKKWVKQIIGAEPKEKHGKIYYPGQIEGENYEHRLKNGIPISKHDSDVFEQLAVKFHIEKPPIEPT